MWIGVAIGIPDPYRAEFTKARADAQDPQALLIPPHVTLLPPTQVARSGLPELTHHLAKVAERHAPFTMKLKGTETFRPISPVVFVPLMEGADHCTELQAEINSGMVAQELRFPYHPHVTIGHELSDEVLDAARASMSGFVAEFLVAAFELYQHGEDGVWRELASFPLRHPGV